MKFEGIDLGFLWNDINEKILDAPNPFDEKWRSDMVKCTKFNKGEGSLEKILQLLIIAYKDESPRDWFNYSENGDAIYKENLCIQEKEHLARKDIQRITEVIKDQNGIDITVERFFEFISAHNFTKMVENTLQGKNFTKMTTGDKTIFKLEKSPIDSIELTSKSFKLKINDEIYKYKY